MKRRDALKTLGALAGSAYASKFLSGCGDNSAGAPGYIDTVVFLMMENRSYDHYLGSRSLVEGLPGDGLLSSMSNPDSGGNSIGVYPNVVNCLHSDPPHGWDASRVQMGTSNDGFILAHQERHGVGAIDSMAYMLRKDIPVTHALADAYTSCDRWFSSLLGPTLPNRMYWHAGTSNGIKGNDGVLNGGFEGVQTIYHQLEKAEVPWRYYFGDVPVLSFVDGLPIRERVRYFNNDFFAEAKAGKLPPVSYIDPSFSMNDDHPPHHPLLGQQLIAATYQALATSPHWEHCLLVVTYDENGGFFDHVPPPKAADEFASTGFDQLGFRVPSLIVGPYAKSGYVSSVQYDHTSALQHIKKVHGLPTLTARADAANDFSDCIDFERMAANTPAPPIQLPGVEVSESELARCSGSSFIVDNTDHDILQWAEANSAKLGNLDMRHRAREGMYEISEYLDRHNLGRIRRR